MLTEIRLDIKEITEEDGLRLIAGLIKVVIQTSGLKFAVKAIEEMGLKDKVKITVEEKK